MTLRLILAVLDSLKTHLRQFGFPLILVAVTTLIQLTRLNDLLDFDRGAIQTGAWWLLLTGHLCHLSWQHFLLNNAALLIIWELFYRQYSIIKAGLEFGFLSVAVGLGIYIFNPNVEWYVGLSGVLHGMFVIGIAPELINKNKLSLLVAAGVIGKIAWEQTVGLTTGVLFAEDSVLVDAHLYGTFGGLFVAIAYFCFTRLKH